MELQREIAKVWKAYQDSNYLPPFIIERSFGFYTGIEKKDILVLGLAPLFHDKSVLKPTKYNLFYHMGDEAQMNPYQKEISRLLSNSDLKLNLLGDTTIFDLFYFRHQSQDSTLFQLLDSLEGRMFLIDQLEITQRVLEEIVQPKVIILNSCNVAFFMGLYGQEADSAWLGYKFEEIESTSSGYVVYKITGIEEDAVCGEKYRENTKLKGTYVICYPTLLTHQVALNKRFLAPHEINYYREISTLEQPFNPSEKNEKSDIDVDFLLKYPALYTYLLKSTSDAKAFLGKSVLADLKQYKKMSTNKMAYAIFSKLALEKILLTEDVSKLCDSKFCTETFNTKEAILHPKKIGQLVGKKRFTEPFELCGNQFFYLSSNWRPQHKETLERWFVDIMYYSKINKYE